MKKISLLIFITGLFVGIVNNSIPLAITLWIFYFGMILKN